MRRFKSDPALNRFGSRVAQQHPEARVGSGVNAIGAEDDASYDLCAAAVQGRSGGQQHVHSIQGQCTDPTAPALIVCVCCRLPEAPCIVVRRLRPPGFSIRISSTFCTWDPAPKGPGKVAQITNFRIRPYCHDYLQHSVVQIRFCASLNRILDAAADSPPRALLSASFPVHVLRLGLTLSRSRIHRWLLMSVDLQMYLIEGQEGGSGAAAQRALLFTLHQHQYVRFLSAVWQCGESICRLSRHL